ncbi:MAG TPA: TMEM175 family protein [Thermomicrobiales bacterium]|nr:TMEM175 family protein [Thermomicrobiales bacterium]
MAAERRETNRLEAFSDGVIAIAITLLVLELQAPDLPEASPAALWRALGDLWPAYVGYVISFATIGIMWANHRAIFELIDRVDHELVLTNLLLLFCIGVLPFPTSLVAAYLGRPAEGTAVLVYSGWFLLTAIAYNLTWRAAARGRRLIDPAANPAAVAAIDRRFRIGPPAYALAFVVAFVSPEASLAVLFLLALTYVLPYGRRREA